MYSYGLDPLIIIGGIILLGLLLVVLLLVKYRGEDR